LSPEWLRRFRDDPDDKPDLQRQSTADWRGAGTPIVQRPKAGWLDKFRDDATEPPWREGFPDDAPEGRAQAADGPKLRARAERRRAPLTGGISRNIRLFEWLMYVSFAVETVSTASDFSKLAQLVGGWQVVLLSEILTIAFFSAFVFLAVYRRKKWALYVIAAFYGFRLLRYIPSFAYIALPLVQFLSAVEFVLQGLALFYGLSTAARSHFARRPH
jgi:hypothetical protein